MKSVDSVTRPLASMLAAGIVLLPALPARAEPAVEPWSDRIDPWVLNTALDAPSGQTEFIVYLREQADLSGAAALLTKAEKGRFVYARLTETARRSQAKLLGYLDQLGVEHRSLWMANMIWTRGDLALAEALANHPDVEHLCANPAVRRIEPPVQTVIPRLASPAAVEWNISLVGAPGVWAQGYTGQGVVVAGQDTGYDWQHPALINHYRGWDGTNADHNYNWHDAIHTNNPHNAPGNPCGYDSLQPCDDLGHGTHTMGTMVGDDGNGNQIGMAPGAKWIGARNMEQNWGSPASYTECFQWFVAPTDLNGQNPDPSKAPDVINNSWYCPSEEGCTYPDMLRAVVENTRAAGIVVVVSAGNSGSACGSVSEQPALYQAAFSVGATDSSDNIASFSSRGPVTVDGSGRLKPDVLGAGGGRAFQRPRKRL